jgi:predicted ATPase/DNA-binding SARP family transcriptional activator
MDFRLLGPLEVVAQDCPLALGGGKQRLLLAVLLAHANETVSSERLVDALWGETPPPTAMRSLHNQVSGLRKLLGDGRLLTRTPGYVLRVEPSELDVARFERLLGEADRAEPAAAAVKLREALALWRGPPLADLSYEPFARGEIARLEEMRLVALEQRIDADLACGRHADLVGELQQLTGRHPWRERLHAQRLLALYRSGRQADALEVYRQTREALVAELGIEPGRELRNVQQAILTQDPRIDGPQPADARISLPRLPAPPNRTIGRERDLEDVRRRLLAGMPRLLTLVGPGGVGKTRLALDVGHAAGPHFVDGARLVSLQAVRRPEDVPVAILQELAIVMVAGESPERAVERYLAVKRLLLVLDNCEHVLGAAPFVAALLAACPGVTVLATSREPLGIQAEECRPVPPLAGDDAITLFCERARARDPGFELGNGDAVVEICRRVDGLPLAIELAAARCGLLTPAEIADRLDVALGTPGTAVRDAPVRQQTLRATIDWSHALLDGEEQVCFARFAVFTGGATVEAAEPVTGAGLSTLDHLVGKSLLSRSAHPDGRTRLLMLETVRSYAAERLTGAPDHEAVRERHYRYFLALAQRHGTERALWGAMRGEHLAALDGDIENLHAALQWVIDQDDAERALALCEALGCYWLMRARYAEAVDRIDRVLHLPASDAHPELRVRVLCTKLRALFPLGRAGERPPIFDEAEAIASRLPDLRYAAEVAFVRTAVAMDTGESDVADALADEAVRLAQAAGDDLAIAMAAFAKTLPSTGAAELRERVERAASLLDEAGIVYQLGYLLGSAAYVALCAGSDAYAADLVRRAIPATRDLDSPHLRAHLCGNAGLTALFCGDIDDAREAFREELALCREHVIMPWTSEGLAGLAAIAALENDLDRAARLAGAAAAHTYGQADDEVDARRRGTFLEPARAQHGPDAWDAAEREGAALSFDDAIAYALAQPAADPPPRIEPAGAG